MDPSLSSSATNKPGHRGRLALIALVVAALCVGLALSQIHEAFYRSNFKLWAPWLAGAGLMTWIGAYVAERRSGRRLGSFTAILLGLALAAVVLQNGSYLGASLAGDRVRAWNVFHYYIGSKYFSELSYYDLYGATLAADDDWQAHKRAARGKARKRIKKVRDFRKIKAARDQRDYEVKDRAKIVASFDRSLISPERLEELGRDTRFLRNYMGFGSPGWPDCFQDLGYNPAPPWTVVGTPLANIVPTNSRWFWFIANSDLPGYLLAIVLCWWAFGLRTTAVMALWLNTFQINEARFTGGFLQYDWLVSVLCTAAFYQRGRFKLAGLALSWGAMTRVFPGFLIIGIALQAGLALLGWRGDNSEARSDQSAWQRVPIAHRQFLGAFTLACTVLFVGSNLTGGGLNTWPEWVDKIARHSDQHAVTSNQRIGVGRLVIHKPSEGRFWAQASGPREQRVAQGKNRKHLLQLLGLLLLIPALIRRRGLDALILPLFAVLLMVVLSRYYASTWALLFLLGTPARAAPEREAPNRDAPTQGVLEEDRGEPWPRFLAGVVLLFMAAGFYPLGDRTVGYFLINYLALGMFVLLALGYLLQDLRQWRRQKTPPAPPPAGLHARPETP